MTTRSSLQVPTAPCCRRNRATRLRNTTGLSGELPAGDIVCVGEVALAVARPARWEPAGGPLTEARTRDTAPARSRRPATPRAAGRHLTRRRRTTVNEEKTVTVIAALATAGHCVAGYMPLSEEAGQ